MAAGVNTFREKCRTGIPACPAWPGSLLKTKTIHEIALIDFLIRVTSCQFVDRITASTGSHDQQLSN